MEQFQDLEIITSPENFDSIIKALTETATAPWSRCLEGEENIGDTRFNVFERQGDAELPISRLALHREEDRLKVVNITSKDVGNLGCARYNAILSDFRRRIVDPVAAQFNLTVVVGLPSVSLPSVLGSDAAELLRKFSNLANKSTGRSHPSDSRRWFQFIFSAFVASNDDHSELLFEALIKDHGWPKNAAKDLVEEYRFAIELLNAQAGRA